MTSSTQRLPQKMIKFNTVQEKIFYTLLFLAIYRVGVHIPIPGVNAEALKVFFSMQGGNLLGMFNMFSGGALERFSILALGIMPYISASIISQLLTVVVPHLQMLSKEGDAGRKKITQYTRYGTVILALFQGYMLASSLESAAPSGGSTLVLTQGMAWRIQTMISLTAGTSFVMWLGERITDKGVGNGISLIIFAGIVAGLPGIISNQFTKISSQELDLYTAVAIAIVCIMVMAGVVFMEQGARQIRVQYAKRQVGRNIVGGQSSHIPVRVNTAGVIPAIFASSLLQAPVTAAMMSPNNKFSEIISSIMIPGGWLYNTVYIALVIFFAFFYTSIVFKPDDIAENLKKHGGYIPGVRPGRATSDLLAKILNRLTLIGGIYLALVCVIPTLLMDKFKVPFYFGGTSLLIVVGVALETFRQIEGHRQSLKYDPFLKKRPKIRSRGRYSV